MSQHHDAPGDRLPQRTTRREMTPLGQGHVKAACPSCGRSGLQAMAFRLNNGDRAELRRCSHCEWRCWQLGDRRVALAELLEVVHDAGLPRAPRRRRAG